MVNPITAAPLVMPADLLATELPGALARPAARVSAPGGGSDTGTATSGDPSRPDTSQSTPLEKTLEQLNTSMQAWATGMRFDLDEDAQRLVVSIVDSKSGETLRTIPNDAVLRVAKMIVQLQGSMISVKA